MFKELSVWEVRTNWSKELIAAKNPETALKYYRDNLKKECKESGTSFRAIQRDTKLNSCEFVGVVLVKK